MVDGKRPSVRAIARTARPCPRSSAMSSRSANDRYRPDSGVSWIDGMPPRSRNQRTPTGPDTPHAIAASSLESPSAIFIQNPRSTSRRTGGRPGDRIAGRPVSVTIHPRGRPIQHLHLEMLRRPVEFTQYTAIAFGQRCGEMGVRPSMGSVGDAYDNAMCESFFATLECELLDRQRFRTQADARLAVFDFIEGWYNPRRRHSALEHLSPMIFERTHVRADRPVPAGSTIDQGGAISLSPSESVR